MTTSIGINGFGRIGRQVCRIVFERNDYKCVISGINSLESPEYLAHMFKYDTIHGKWSGCVSYTDNSIIINGRNIRVFQYRDPKQIPWKSIGVEYVCESTGFFTTSEKAKVHIQREEGESKGAKYVVISAPPKDDTPMFVMGVNQEKYSGEKIVSCASCTTNCLAPLVKIINAAINRNDKDIASSIRFTFGKIFDGAKIKSKNGKVLSVQIKNAKLSNSAVKALSDVSGSVSMRGANWKKAFTPDTEPKAFDVALWAARQATARPTQLEAMIAALQAQRATVSKKKAA